MFFIREGKSAECGRARSDWLIGLGCALGVGIAKANSTQPTEPLSHKLLFKRTRNYFKQTYLTISKINTLHQ